ncbi:MAG: NUDIX hydrolase [Cytophagaceae bacterium]
MKLFLNDKAINIIALTEDINQQDYDVVLNGNEEITSKKLSGQVLVVEGSPNHIYRLIKILEVKKLKRLSSVTFAVSDKEQTIDFVKDQFKIIKAAGGLVRKGDKILMIYRLDKWDLPKGKLEKKEDTKEGAQREVEEECNIKVEVKEKLCKTWHTYVRKGKRILKRTDWYVMDCLNDSKMEPQVEEDIDEVRWMDKKEVKKALKNSYASIQEVFENFYNKDTKKEKLIG